MEAYRSEAGQAHGVCVLDETTRLDVLEAHRPEALVDDPELVRITQFAADLCGAPIALVSLVESERQAFIARTGLSAPHTPRSQSFCQFAMLGEAIMEVVDATADPRFVANPLVTGPPHVRFYAGAPLVSAEGAPLGSLCVIDRSPRPGGLTALQRDGLAVLAQAVMRRLDDRRNRSELSEALDESERRFAALANAMPQMAWSTDGAGQVDYFNARWYDYVGGTAGAHDGQGWLEVVHPDDREATREGWERAVIRREPYEVEYRLRGADGSYRWFLGQGVPMVGTDGGITRWFGTCTDIHDRQQIGEARELLNRELSHRIQNIFSVIGGLIHLESRGRPEFAEAASALTARIAALGRAHDHVSPKRAGKATPRSLHSALAELFAPYAAGGAARVIVGGADAALGERAALPLALIFHELATNSMKYGALGDVDGTVVLDIAREADWLSFDWREPARPQAAGPRGEGFGSTLIEVSVTRQLGGTITQELSQDGLHAHIRLPLDRLER